MMGPEDILEINIPTNAAAEPRRQIQLVRRKMIDIRLMSVT